MVLCFIYQLENFKTNTDLRYYYIEIIISWMAHSLEKWTFRFFFYTSDLLSLKSFLTFPGSVWWLWPMVPHNVRWMQLRPSVQGWHGIQVWMSMNIKLHVIKSNKNWDAWNWYEFSMNWCHDGIQRL